MSDANRPGPFESRRPAGSGSNSFDADVQVGKDVQFDKDVQPPGFPHRRKNRGNRGGRTGPSGSTLSGTGPGSPLGIAGVLLAVVVIAGGLALLLRGGGDDQQSLAVPSDVASNVVPGNQDVLRPTGDATPTGTAAPQQTEVTTTPQVASVLQDQSSVEVFAPEGFQQVTAFAVQFAHDYLNYNEDAPDLREQELQAYLAPGLDPQLGWDGMGQQIAVLTIPVGARQTEDGFVVTVAAQVSGFPAPKWIHLAVPVAVDANGRPAVTAPPAYVPRPPAGSPDLGTDPAVDPALTEELQPGMQELFTAFAAEERVLIDGVTSEGVQIRGLGGPLRLEQLGPLQVHVGGDAARTAAIEVTWLDPATLGQVTQSYVLGLVRSGEAWLVRDISSG